MSLFVEFEVSPTYYLWFLPLIKLLGSFQTKIKISFKFL
jgi:hypothetical protein